MFEELVGSGARQEVRPLRGLVVAALHGVLIAGAVRATTSPREPDPVPVATIPFVLVAKPRVDPVATATATDPVSANPLPPDLRQPPIDLPSGLPPILPGPAIDPEMLRHVVGLGRPGGIPGDSTGATGIPGATQVDEPAVAIYQPSPRYPPVLQQAGIEGRVTVEFVIDTLGRMEPESLRVLDSSNAGFNAAAVETLRLSRFRPARIRGGAVRQRTIQAVAFRIGSS
jgi:TonB family protein